TTGGTVSGPTGGPFTISGSHTYTEDGTFTVTASFVDDAPSTLGASIFSTANVAESPLQMTGTPVAATEGAPFSGTVATFTDANTAEPADEYTATIDWGDGSATTAGTVSAGPGGTFSVAGSHTYAEEGAFT